MPETATEWFLLDQPTFTHAEVCKITSVPSASLQNWANRGLVPDVEAAGKGSRRSYSASQLSCITFAKQLIDLGFETGISLSAAMSLQVSVLKFYRDSLKANHSPKQSEEKLVNLAAFFRPDPSSFRHSIRLFDLRTIDASKLDLRSIELFIPCGALLGAATVAALSVRSKDEHGVPIGAMIPAAQASKKARRRAAL